MVGKSIGCYRITGPLGSGAMGQVFAAVHARSGELAAIKVLHAQHAENPQLVARFFKEARAVRLAQHPGIVAIHDCGQLLDGTVYIVMEYLRGEPLGVRLLEEARGGVRADAPRLCRQIAAALAAAHAQGVVHRDLKPDNIMLVPAPETPGGERVKVLDFGIAKLAAEAEAEAEEQSLRTQCGVLLGTPAYMAPELCRGAAGATCQADVYSLGVLFYQMLCGRLPFSADGLAEMLMLHLYAAPPPLRSLDPTIAPELEALVGRMLAKRPEERPTMAQVVEALTPRAAQPTTMAAASWRRSVAIAAGSALLALAGIGVAARAQGPQATVLLAAPGPAVSAPHPPALAHH